MKRVITQIAMLFLGAAVSAQVTPPPAPPAMPAPQAAPAPKATRKPPAVKVYRYAGTAPAMAESGSYLGVDINDITADRAKELKLKSDQGVEITMVDQDSPAGKAGLKEHDAIVTFNGQTVQSEEQFRRLIRETKAGQMVALGVVRDGQPQNINVALGDRAKMYSHAMPKIAMAPRAFTMRMPDIDIPAFIVSSSSRRNGITVENLTSQLGEYFGVKNGEGVLVRSVEKGSKAEAAGLKAGDVIIRVDNERVSDTREFSRLLRGHDAGAAKLGILRDRREQSLSLPIEKSDESNYWYVGPEWEDAQRQWVRLGPQFAREQAELQSKIQRELASHQRDIQQAMREAQREVERSMREI